MSYNLIISIEAEKQMIAITDYLLLELGSIQAVEHLYREIERIYDRLENNPKQFPFCEDVNLREKQYRKAVLSQMNYTLIFKNVKKNVYIIGIFHDSQNYGEQL